MKSLQTIQPNYVERADNGTREAMGSLIDSGMIEFNSGLERANKAGAELIKSAAEIWNAGRKFTEAESLSQHEFKNWNFSIEDWKAGAELRFKMEIAKRIYRAIPKEPKKLEECKPALQLMFEACGLIKKISRIEAQSAHLKPSYFSILVSDFADIEHNFSTFEKSKPMDQWEDDELEKFVRTTQLLSEKHAAAKSIYDRRNHGS